MVTRLLILPKVSGTSFSSFVFWFFLLSIIWVMGSLGEFLCRSIRSSPSEGSYIRVIIFWVKRKYLFFPRQTSLCRRYLNQKDFLLCSEVTVWRGVVTERRKKLGDHSLLKIYCCVRCIYVWMYWLCFQNTLSWTGNEEQWECTRHLRHKRIDNSTRTDKRKGGKFFFFFSTRPVSFNWSTGSLPNVGYNFCNRISCRTFSSFPV